MTYHHLGNFAFTEGSTAGSTPTTVGSQGLNLITPTETYGSRSTIRGSRLLTSVDQRSDMNLDIMSTSPQTTVARQSSYPTLVSSPLATTSNERAYMNYNITGAAQNLATQGTLPTIDQGALNTYLRQKAQADAEKAAEAKRAAVLSAGNTLRVGPGFTYTTSGSGSSAATSPEVDPGGLTSTAPPCQPWPSCGQGQPGLVDEEPFYKHPAVIGGGILLLLAAGYAIYKSQGG